MIYDLVSKKSFQLSKKEIKNICLLKNNQWKFGIKSQLNWYKKNIKKKDIHNMMFINSKLIGYTLLRRRRCLVNKVLKKYLLFDTLVLHKKYRNKKLSNLIMYFDNEIIKQNKKLSFLICKKDLVDFYKKFNWKLIKNNNISIPDHSFSTNGMIFNYNNTQVGGGVKYIFYINK